MADETDFGGGLDGFLASKGMLAGMGQEDGVTDGGQDTEETRDDLQEHAGASEEGQELSGDGNQDDTGESLSDEEEGTEQVQDSRSRLVRNIARLERTATDLRSELRDMKSENERLRRQAEEEVSTGDDLEVLQRIVAKRLGLKPDDDRVMEHLLDVSRDITALRFGEDDPDLKKRREELMTERQRREERIRQERRIEELERRDRDRQVEIERREAIAGIGQMLATEHPFLNAAVDDPATAVYDLAMEAITSGKVPTPRDPQIAARLLKQIAGNLERHHRTKAERLAGLLGKADDSATNRIGTRVNTDDRDKAAKRTQTGATKRRAPAVGSNGGGGRGRPSPAGDPEMADTGPEDLASFMNRRKSETDGYRRGRR